jgi:dipeptidyl aminopeptidase/acylaminoacyl peptidase
MPAEKSAAYGTWKSPITTSLITQGGLRLGEVRLDSRAAYCLEGRPAEGGRNAVVRLGATGARDVLPPGFNARNRVHEYGGGAYAAHGGTVYFTNWDDQRIYAVSASRPPAPVTPAPASPHGLRYADLQVTPDGRHIVAVRERHEPGQEAVNEVVAIPVSGGDPAVLASGYDFYAFPRVSPDQSRIAWTAWRHPQMPWDGCELWTARLSSSMKATGPRKVAGGESESIFQPSWSPDGSLHFISDRTGWWNLYALNEGRVRPLAPLDEECGVAQWVFGLSTYAFLDGGAVAFVHQTAAGDRIGLLEDGRWHDLDISYTSVGSVQAAGRDIWFVGANARTAPEVVRLNVDTARARVLKKSLALSVDAEYLSAPRPITFQTGPIDGPARRRNGSRVAHALFYPPHNPGYQAPAGERPPLIVISHGGPTSAASSALSLSVQFWTSRGFGVVDVNYRGSTGYGRAYRDALRGEWGIADVEDCVAAARHLAREGEADEARLIIRGGSAGGYTTLCALTFTSAFAAGASYYGVADAETLAKDTHKFESRYLDGLIGPYPAARETYFERSPAHFADRMSCPLIMFQGLEDKIVPPSQAEAMAEALDAGGLPYAYVAFEGEQHGFRKAENISRSLEAELYFYGRVFAFRPADAIKPVRIKNSARLRKPRP